MIRLPPTSIGLSESDIHFHLRQVSVYQSLRAQGFNKEDIQRYYAEHQALKKACENECESPSERTASWGSADVLRGSVESEEFPTGLPPTPGFRCAAARPLPTGIARTDTPGLQRHPVTSSSPPTLSPPSSPPLLPLNLPYRHATVRQSSLLRFHQNAGSQNSSSPAEPDPRTYSDGQDQDLPEPVVFLTSPARARSYRPRSQSYPWDQSEAEDARTSHSQYEYITDSLSTLSLGRHITGASALRADAPEFTPRLPPPFSATRRVSSSPFTPSRITQTLARPTDLTPGDMASSPPPRSSSLSSSVSLPPATPTSSRISYRLSRTEERNVQGHESVRVYNDALPPLNQPQTPADLTRRPLFTEREAAYTAPPGMIGRNTINLVRQNNERARNGGLDIGEQSPTVRAVDIRERRARELRRGTRLQAWRWARIGGDPGSTWGMDGPRADTWRDELDLDRVGEENFGETGRGRPPGDHGAA